MNSNLIYQMIFGLLVSCLVIFDVNAQENFKGIIPMVTTKSEVEKILGKPNKYGDYELDEGRVHVDYYERECEKKIECFCLVPLGTVRFISIELYYDLYLKDLNLDAQKFEETRSSHLPGIYSYLNSKTGVVYEVQGGKVTHIYYNESEDTCNEIKQKFSKPESRNNQNKEKHIYSIPNLSFEVEKRRLDKVAKELNSDLTKLVYLVAYNETKKKKLTATNRLEKSRNYLIKKHSVSSKRIITVYGSTKDAGIVMEIFIVDSNSPNPTVKEKSSVVKKLPVEMSLDFSRRFYSRKSKFTTRINQPFSNERQPNTIWRKHIWIEE